MSNTIVKISTPYEYGQSILAVLVVISFGAIGGIIVKMLNGIQTPKILCIKSIRIRSVFGAGIIIPPLLGFILFGFIARNYFAKGTLMTHYPDVCTSYIRNLILALLELSLGMSITIKGNLKAMLFLFVIPQFIEATVIAVLGIGFFKLPISIAYTMGYTIASVGPSILLPCLFKMTRTGYGTK